MLFQFVQGTNSLMKKGMRFSKHFSKSYSDINKIIKKVFLYRLSLFAAFFGKFYYLKCLKLYQLQFLKQNFSFSVALYIR